MSYLDISDLQGRLWINKCRRFKLYRIYREPGGLVRGLKKIVPGDTLILITSDHGMV